MIERSIHNTISPSWRIFFLAFFLFMQKDFADSGSSESSTARSLSPRILLTQLPPVLPVLPAVPGGP